MSELVLGLSGKDANGKDVLAPLRMGENGALHVGNAVRIETAPVNLDINATPSVSAAITAPIVRITTDQDCLILQGANPVITSSNGVIHLAGRGDYHHTPGDKVAVLQLNAIGVAQIVGVSF